MASTKKDVKKLVQDIIDNPDVLDDILNTEDEDLLRAVYEQMHPYGIVTNVHSKNKFTCFSMTNFAEDYIKKLNMTATIGFLNRAVDEDMDLKEEEKRIIKNFHQKHFNYNPDQHLRSALDVYEKVREGTVPTDEELKYVPPADTFARIERYTENNYESLRQITDHIYGRYPEYECAIQIYDSFETEEEAQRFIAKHEKEFVLSVRMAPSSKWTCLAPYKENREKSTFRKTNMDLLTGMLQMSSEAERLMSEMSNDRVRKEKRRNIQECGPDDPGLEAAANVLSPAVQSGIVRGTTDKERKKMSKNVLAQTASSSSTLDDSNNSKDNTVLPEGITPEAAAHRRAQLQRIKDQDFDLKEYNAKVEEAKKMDQKVEDNAPDSSIAVKVYKTDGKEMKSAYFYTKEKAPE